MKLEDLLGAELYAQVQAKLDEVNGKEPDKTEACQVCRLIRRRLCGKG